MERQVEIEFNKAFNEFDGTNPTKRFVINRQACTRKFADAINILNEDSPQHLTQHATFAEMNTTVYAVAVAVTRINRNNITYM